MRTMLGDAIEVVKAHGEYVGIVPENSAVGESASNGRAERAVQSFEDYIRTLLAELEHRLGQQVAPSHPLLAWLVEYSAVLLNKYDPCEATGVTPYELLHGKPAEERLAYFGETLYVHCFTQAIQFGRTMGYWHMSGHNAGQQCSH